MPIHIDLHTDQDKIHQTALRSTIKFLNNHPTFKPIQEEPSCVLNYNVPEFDLSVLNHSPELLSEFLSDIVKGTHKKWHVYRTMYSKALAKLSKGRPEPQKKLIGIAIHKTERLARMYKRAEETFIPNLYLRHLKTDKQRIKAILESDCSPQIKADLLEVYT